MQKQKKRIAILLPWLKMGGTNKVALDLMRELLPYFNITLILNRRVGELLEYVPQGVDVVIDSIRDFRSILYEDIRRFRVRFIFKDLVYYAKVKLGLDGIDNYKYLASRNEPATKEQFDCVISYHGQSPEGLINMLYRTKGKCKIAWIHGEFSGNTKHCRRMARYYSMLDYIFFVSEPTRRAFLKLIPFDEQKTVVYYNPIDAANIRRLSMEEDPPELQADAFNILTVGRVSKEKGQQMIPVIMQGLKSKGYRVNWYVIGEGDQSEKLKQSILEYGVDDCVKLLGVKVNPYGYMRACNLYVQPSFTEGYCTTICEAGILHKAIIGTVQSGGIDKQLTNELDGLIVDANPKALSDAIERLMNETQTIERFEKNIALRDYQNEGEIIKLIRLLGVCDEDS